VSLSLACGLGGCGAAYISSAVAPQAGEAPVTVIDLTAQAIARANATPFTPPALPAAFMRIASADRAILDPSLPAPVHDPELRPDDIPSRLPPPVSPAAYRIGVGDVLALTTPAGEATAEELAGLVASQNRRQGYTVQDDGTIAVPEIGRIPVVDLTVDAAEARILERLLSSQIDPSFGLEVAEFNARRVTIGGAVGAPGTVPLTMTPLYLEELLLRAGGLQGVTEGFAVLRLYRDEELYQIPVQHLLSGEGVQTYRVVDGDSVFVDAAYSHDRAQAFFEEQIRRAEFTRDARANALSALREEIEINRAALDESRQNFRDRLELGAAGRTFAYVIGEVRQPGRFALPFNDRATMADALFDAGGLREATGNPRQVYLLRGAYGPSAPAVTAYRLDASNAASLVMATQMELRPGDILFVGEQPVTRWNRMINQISPAIINLGASSIDGG